MIIILALGLGVHWLSIGWLLECLMLDSTVVLGNNLEF